MKKLFTLMLSAVMTASFISCNNNNKKQVDNTNEVLAYKTITVKKTDDAFPIQFKFIIDFPIQGEEALVNEIKKNIFDNINDSTHSDLSEEGLYKVANKYISDNTAEFKEMEKEFDNGFKPSYSYEGSIKVIDNTDKYITYKTISDDYAGGAHGMPYSGYFTIDKETNKTLSLYDIFDANKKEDLKDIIKINIVNQYFEGEEPDWSGNVFKFDLPSQTPGITSKGIVFCYGAYEIECYAAGMPHCTIPFDEISDLMTPYAKALIE